MIFGDKMLVSLSFSVQFCMTHRASETCAFCICMQCFCVSVLTEPDAAPHHGQIIRRLLQLACLAQTITVSKAMLDICAVGPRAIARGNRPSWAACDQFANCLTSSHTMHSKGLTPGSKIQCGKVCMGGRPDVSGHRDGCPDHGDFLPNRNAAC